MYVYDAAGQLGSYLLVEAGHPIPTVPNVGAVETRLGMLGIYVKGNRGFEIRGSKSVTGGKIPLIRAMVIDQQLKDTARLAITLEADQARLGPATAITPPHNLLSNGSFEQGMQEWQSNGIVPPNAVIDEKESFTGGKSVRLDVKKGESTDLVRYFPVVAGESYSIEACLKTRNVTDGAASLVVEWADQNKGWLQTGGYSPAVSGTTDWQKVFVLPSPTTTAPKGAKYAIIFLLCRGIGTAWFDDVRVTSYVSPPVEVTEPKNGAVLQNNRPTFCWNRLPAIAPYVLELSPSPSFLPKETRQFVVAQDEYTPPKPLASGKYYWRVRLKPSDRFSKVRVFEQTASPNADTSGPTLIPRAQYMPDKKGRLVVTATDASGIDDEHVDCRVDGVPAKVKIAGEQLEITPVTEWKRLNWIELTVSDRLKNETTVRFPVTSCPPRPRGHFRGDGVMMVDADPIFPIGIYQVVKADFPAAKRVGFNLVHDYAWEDSPDDGAVRDYLDAAHQNGLKCFIGFDRGTADRPGLSQKNSDMVARRVAALMDHPALFAWYLVDEPEGKMMPPFLVQRYRELINRLDPFHPTIAVIGMHDTSPYAGTIDWHWSESYMSAAMVAQDFDGRRRGMGGVPQCAINYISYPRNQADGSPLTATDIYRQYRQRAYAAIARGSNGLMYWWWSWWADAMVLPVRQTAMTRLLNELHALEPVLVAEAKPERPGVSHGSILTWSKVVKNRMTVIAVNLSGNEIYAQILAGRNGKCAVLFEGRTLSATAGMIEDRFGPDDVHVYEIK